MKKSKIEPAHCLILLMRQLAAIMFADMAGYTAMMQENEQLARTKRQRLKEVLEKAVDSHNGKILQYYGDGSLSIFGSSIDSVAAAIQIQMELGREPKVDLRIGIHTGDISIEEDAVYGDGVNLASRVESLALPGSILITEKLLDDLKNHQHIQTKELGFFELKNIKQPVGIHAISNEGLIVPNREQLSGKTKFPSNRLAVLPFVNMSSDPDNEYFSDGITEELLNALTKVVGLQVTSRTSAFAFKGKHDDIRTIGQKLNVDKILEGSVRRAGNRVRITAQLINTADGYHVWSENYDRNLNDIFAVQDEISGIIANKLRENLSSTKKEQLVKTEVRNIDAYTLYLKALHFRNKLTPPDTRKAIECLEEAIELEPEYARAYGMIAGAYSFLGATGQIIPEIAFNHVREYSEKALALDSSIAESHIAKAGLYLIYDRKPKLAYDALQKAISINPTAAEAYQLLGYYYILGGKKEEAVKILEKGLEIDPLSPILNKNLADAYAMNERYDDALVICDRLIDMNPEMRIAIEGKGWCIGMKGDWQTAKQLFQEVYRLTGHPLKGLGPLGFAHAKLGEAEQALEIVNKILKRQEEEPDAVVDGDLLMVWWALKDLEKVYYYAKQCYEKRVGVQFFIQFPMMKGIEKDPRIAEIMKKASEPYLK